VLIARAVGIEEAEIEAVRGPIDAGPWDEEERLALEAADELHADATISDTTWGALAAHFDEASLIELVMLVGQYHLVAMTLRTLRIAIEEP